MMIDLHSYLSKRRSHLFHKSTFYKFRRRYINALNTKLNLSLIIQTKIILFTILLIILCLFIFIYHQYSIEIHGDHSIDPLYTPLNPIHHRHSNQDKQNQWVSFGGYAGLPFYYSKKGSVNNDISINKEEIKKLVTVTSFCDINLLYEAQKIAINYISGPISLSVFMDADYRQHSDQDLQQLFDGHFANISNKYDITIGILYANTSDTFYQSKGFLPSTPLVFRLPMNPLRNLAEYQVITDWTFNIDVDFWYLSKTLNQNVDIFINEMTNIANVYGDKSIFIIPSFEVLTENKPQYSSLNKSQLIHLTHPQHDGQIDIMPFHFIPHRDIATNTMELLPGNPQQCTGYNRWYSTTTNYKINYLKPNCSLFYEPWYIIKTNISRNALYRWDDRFVGRGYSKTQRVNTLRHHCFNFIVMKDLFIIHAAETVHVKLNQTLRNHWTGKNRELLIKQTRIQYKDKNSCLTAPISVKIVRFLRAVLLGFAQMTWDSLATCVNGCKC